MYDHNSRVTVNWFEVLQILSNNIAFNFKFSFLSKVDLLTFFILFLIKYLINPEFLSEWCNHASNYGD